ncbi:MAG: hypothetical protein GXW94_17225 [Serratia liquefaciens]|nr:hypothetical protein [Serratia liquefaciens]
MFEVLYEDNFHSAPSFNTSNIHVIIADLVKKRVLIESITDSNFTAHRLSVGNDGNIFTPLLELLGTHCLISFTEIRSIEKEPKDGWGKLYEMILDGKGNCFFVDVHSREDYSHNALEWVALPKDNVNIVNEK